MRHIGWVLVLVVAAACNSGGKLGSRCRSNDDCKGPAVCGWKAAAVKEGIEGLAEVCTNTCKTSNECQDSFGEDAFCNGVGLCAMSCRQDADCPSHTFCKDNYFCAR